VALSPFDVIWLVATPFIALYLRDPRLFSSEFLHSSEFALATIICGLPIFAALRLSEGLSRYFSVHDLWVAVTATFVTTTTSTVALFTFDRLESVPRSTPAIYGLVLGAGLLAARVSHASEPADRKAPPAPHLRRVVLLGVDRFAAIAINLTDFQEPRTTQIISALDDRARLMGRTINGVKIVGKFDDLESVISEYALHGIEIDEVWFLDKYVSGAALVRLECRCKAMDVTLRSLPRALNLTPLQASTPRVDIPDPSVAQKLNVNYFRLKRMIDVVAVLLLLAPLSPLALILAVATRIDVGAPVIFWQQRLGRHGKRFTLYKYRTYQAPYARNGAPIDAEARLSKIARVIRATRFDELPQLFNILRGDMSLIGPRPLLPKDQPLDPHTRLLVRPGLTGWAQVNGGALVTADEKNALDIWYIQNACLALDLVILWRTLMTVFEGEQRDTAVIEAALR
jgi:lipopolysaccharide/colanic/teichoic acid biosynthesis glycosyltransferase